MMETISSVAQEFFPVCQAFYDAHQFQIFTVLFGVAAAVLVMHITKKLIHAAFTLVVFVLLLYLRGALPAILANFH